MSIGAKRLRMVLLPWIGVWQVINEEVDSAWRMRLSPLFSHVLSVPTWLGYRVELLHAGFRCGLPFGDFGEGSVLDGDRDAWNVA